jgi:molecular chaperone DnaK
VAAFGIDFGTSTTAIAKGGQGVPHFVLDLAGRDIVPSVVAFTPSGRIEVGSPAKARRLIDPANTLYSLKRILGQEWDAPTAREFRERYPFQFQQGPGGEIRVTTRAGAFSPSDVTVKMITTLRDAGKIKDEDISTTCVTVPVAFSAAQRLAVMETVQKSGFKNVSVLEEPVAAAYAYADVLKDKQRVAVYDLGGGTFDFAVVEIGGSDALLRGARVLGTDGNAYLGGDDVDLRLSDWCAQQILERHRVDVRTNVVCLSTLIQACERAKMRLSEVDETVINLASIDPQLEGLDLVIRRTQLERLCLDLVQRTFVTCDDVLARVGIGARDLDVVILAGGSTYIPAVRAAVQHYFGLAPCFDRPSDRIIVLGALKYAEAIDKR